MAKKNAKDNLIANILSFKAGHTAEELKALTVAKLEDLIEELDKNMGNEIPPAEAEKGGKAKGDGSPRTGSKRDALYAIFDKAHAEGKSLKEEAKAALPDTSDGVIASYMCYWRKDRGIAAVRTVGVKSKATKADKLKAAIVKLYGEDYDLEAVIAELKAPAEAE